MSAPVSACAECRMLLGGYVLDALDRDEIAFVERHLAGCPECAREREQLAPLPLLLDLAGAHEAEIAELPPALEDAVLDRFAREHHTLRRRSIPRRIASAARSLARPLPATAVALAVTALALAITLSGGGASSAETYNARLHGLSSASGATATARLVTFGQGTHVSLRVAGLRPQPEAIYELWCVRDDGARVSAGTFRVDRNGRADVALTTAAVPSEYHRLSVERQIASATGWSDQRVLAGSIEYR